MVKQECFFKTPQKRNKHTSVIQHSATVHDAIGNFEFFYACKSALLQETV